MPEASLNETTLSLYRSMLTIRRFEERCNYLFMQGKIPSTLHLYIGQEAVAVGVCAHLTAADYATSTHRPHGHAIAKGVTIRSIMAELYAKRTGCCKGKGGSMHVGDVSVGMFPAIAIVGGNAPLAAGAALAAKRLTEERVAVCFMGDGAMNEGAVHEAMNMAALWDLPVVYVCENNLYEASTTLAVAIRNENLAGRAAAYGMPSVVVDGNDVAAVHHGVWSLRRRKHAPAPAKVGAVDLAQALAKAVEGPAHRGVRRARGRARRRARRRARPAGCRW